MQKILITGATGMIGSNLCRLLLEDGADVYALVRSLDRGRKILPDKCNLVQGDITDPDSLQTAMVGMQLVYHAAGLPEQWLKDPGTYERVNVQGTRNVLEAARQAGVSRVVYTSTIDVFQGQAHQHYDESILDPEPKGTYYERSKQAADVIAVEYLEKGMDIVFLHPSGVYGPGPVGSPGPNDFIRDLILGDVPLLLPGGFPVVLASDCAHGHILTAKQAKAGDRFILSESYLSLTEFAYTVAEVANLKKIPAVMPLWFARIFAAVGEFIAGITGKPPLLPRGQLHFLQWQAHPIATRAIEQLGWQPTPFQAGLRQTIQHLIETGQLPNDREILK